MTAFLNFIHYKKLLFLIFILCLVRYGLLIPAEVSHGVTLSLSISQFGILIVALVCIAASGFLIYSIDNNTNGLNKHNFTYYMLINSIGIGLGFYLCHTVGKPKLFFIFFILAALQYVYANALSQILIIGNLVFAIIIALFFYTYAVFELFPSMTSQNKEVQFFFLELLKDYGIFILCLGLILSLLNNLIDYENHKKSGVGTLATKIGKNKTNKIVCALIAVTVIGVLYYVITYLFSQLIVVGYFLIFIIAPLLYACIKIFNANEKDQYKYVTKILYIVFITCALSLLLFKFIILKQNA